MTRKKQRMINHWVCNANLIWEIKNYCQTDRQQAVLNNNKTYNIRVSEYVTWCTKWWSKTMLVISILSKIDIIIDTTSPIINIIIVRNCYRLCYQILNLLPTCDWSENTWNIRSQSQQSNSSRLWRVFHRKQSVVRAYGGQSTESEQQ